MKKIPFFILIIISFTFLFADISLTERIEKYSGEHSEELLNLINTQSAAFQLQCKRFSRA